MITIINLMGEMSLIGVVLRLGRMLSGCSCSRLVTIVFIVVSITVSENNIILVFITNVLKSRENIQVYSSMN